MRCLTLAVIVLTAAIAMPSFGEDSYLQVSPPVTSDWSGQASPGAPTYDECFRLGWVRGVHVERDEWDSFYQQCAAGQVPFSSGMSVDSVTLNHSPASPHS